MKKLQKLIFLIAETNKKESCLWLGYAFASLVWLFISWVAYFSSVDKVAITAYLVFSIAFFIVSFMKFQPWQEEIIELNKRYEKDKVEKKESELNLRKKTEFNFFHEKEKNKS